MAVAGPRAPNSLIVLQAVLFVFSHNEAPRRRPAQRKYASVVRRPAIRGACPRLNAAHKWLLVPASFLIPLNIPPQSTQPSAAFTTSFGCRHTALLLYAFLLLDPTRLSSSTRLRSTRPHAPHPFLLPTCLPPKDVSISHHPARCPNPRPDPLMFCFIQTSSSASTWSAPSASSPSCFCSQAA